MNKAKLRTAYKAKRETITDSALQTQSLAIANQALTLPIWEANYYHLFLPITRLKEVNSEFLLHILQGKDKSVVLSKSDFTNNTLSHFLLEDNTVIRTNSYGIPEPESGLRVPADHIDVVFVPLLAFDETGNRLGYGKGFYDRFLSSCKPSTIKVGLSLFPAHDKLPHTLTDVPLNYCITPTKVYQF